MKVLAFRSGALFLSLALGACGGLAASSGNGDAGRMDGGTLDAGLLDAGTSDAGEADAGALDGGDPTLTAGVPNHLLLIGRIIGPDKTFAGEILVVDDKIACAEEGDTCGRLPEAMGATVIDAGDAIIGPGLIDTHNHILFDILDGSDWLPSRVYTNHTQWPAEARYAAMLDVKQCLADASQGRPAWCPAQYRGDTSLKCEMDKWGELKGLVAGTTSIVGLAGTSSGCFASLARSIDTAQSGLGTDAIQTSALFPPSKASADSVCANFASGKTRAYLIHVGEGTDASALAEFTKLGTVSTTPSCLLAPQTVITHGTAFGSAEFATMAAHQMKLTWSPASNVALYGSTADIPAALGAGVLVALAPDWSMGGSQNLLDELRFAKAWDHAHWGDRLSSNDLVSMVTATPAAALAVDAQLGALKAGLLADLVIVRQDPAHPDDPYAAFSAATPREVLLTMVGGQVLYGHPALQAAGPALSTCERIDVCGAEKFLCIAQPTTANKLNQTYAEMKAALEQGFADVNALAPSSGAPFTLAPLVACGN
jgi:cytosine/adenosine deaminase-related metal-dependent hydrolase